MKRGAIFLGALFVVFLLGSARGQAAGPRLTDDGRTLILLDEIREPQEKRQPGITLTGNPMTGGRQVRIAGHGIAPLREIAAGCGTRSWRVGLSDFRETPATNVATYDVPGDVVTQVLNSPECALLIAGARIAIPRELVSAVWALPGSAPQLPPGKSASSSAPTAAPAESCAVRTPGGDPSRISSGERIRAVKVIEALGVLRDWATSPERKEKAEYASRVAKTEMAVGEYLAGGQGGQGELVSAIRAAMNCFKEALQAWPQVNQPWLSAAENVRGVERYLNVKSLAERQEEERTRRLEVEAKQREAKQREAKANAPNRVATERFLSQIDLPSWSFTVSPDSQRVAYIAAVGNKWMVVVDGTEGKAYDGILEGTPIFSPDSRRLAYGARRGNKRMVVVDGTEGKAYNTTGILVFSPDSRRVAYGAQAGNKWMVVVDGTEGKAYDGIGASGLIFSADSKRVAYSAQVGNKRVVVVDGTEGKAHDGVSEGTPIFSPDSRRVAYGAQVGNKRVVVVDGTEGKAYDGTGKGTLSFSPDSRRVAYGAQVGNKWVAVVDGIEGKTYDGIGSLSFSPDSRRVAYGAQVGNKRMVVVDGTEGKAYDDIKTLGWARIASTPQNRLDYLAQIGSGLYIVEESIEEPSNTLSGSATPEAGKTPTKTLPVAGPKWSK